MDGFTQLLLGLVVAATFVMGVVAVGAGRVIRPMRGQVLRPRIWGWGQISLSLYFAWEAHFRAVVFPHGDYVTTFFLGVPLGVLAFVLVFRGQRPGRPSPAPSEAATADAPSDLSD
jgi:drug/metabolite transporter (DMT)-like permease